MIRSIASFAARRSSSRMISASASASTKAITAAPTSASAVSFNSTTQTMMMTSNKNAVLKHFFSSEGGDIKTGSVKWFDAKKGFGFIVPDDGEDDVFVHQSSIHSEGFRSLADGEPVEYTLTEENGRIKAQNVTGPMGAFVQGRPRREQMFPRDGQFGGNTYGGGGSYGGGNDGHY
eukprot:CAMPEP_0113483890 /NCGR_PEP_ID=MMETSP0014_2-20120614/23671_1 /TAXON_ID=2857 /ORGANISM="Nitzschia sp." /LENGTH=175 /DNA_ID=CAMNT_0000377459 /DNA_START=124 /DNA_END=651 /DNA_ORIENTATION=+ /assembly_acc=CAM_ASM_000159